MLDLFCLFSLFWKLVSGLAIPVREAPVALTGKQYQLKWRCPQSDKELKVSICERKKEIRRRRKRRENYADMKAKLPKADSAVKTKIVEKLKKLSPGADDLIKAWGLK